MISQTPSLSTNYSTQRKDSTIKLMRITEKISIKQNITKKYQDPIKFCWN